MVREVKALFSLGENALISNLFLTDFYEKITEGSIQLINKSQQITQHFLFRLFITVNPCITLEHVVVNAK